MTGWSKLAAAVEERMAARSLATLHEAVARGWRAAHAETPTPTPEHIQAAIVAALLTVGEP